MPMRDVLPASTRGPAVPFCFVCQHRLSVRLLARQPDSGDAQYWTCDDCEVAWVTRDTTDASQTWMGWLNRKRA